ncbi:MAG TPA: GNAT family N-acetyltransferase [Mycobacteriales bacterium]|nr:GNAT family N-acetyltransferase [Mycobacteriales bacterium]
MRSIVDGYWRDALGWKSSTAGVSVVPGLPDYQGIYVLAIEDRACVASPIEVDVATARMRDVMNPEWWSGALDGRVAAVLGPSVHHYLDDTRLLPLSRAVPVERSALEPLRQAVPQNDWNEGGFADEDAEYFGFFEDSELIAASNLTWWRGALSDVGVLTRPGFRGRGVGRQVAAAAARQAISRSGVARYRALETNYPSRAIAERLGFAAYGANLSVRLRPES